MKRIFGDKVLEVATGSAVLLVLAALIFIVVEVFARGSSHLTLAFLTSAPSDGMTAGGIFPAIFGTAALVILMTLACVPIGVATAVYLSEYAPPGSRVARLIRVAVRNLAGMPSIVFGLFGLGFFVQFVGREMDALLYDGAKVYGQPALIWASLTMAILTMPVVIVATEEALRSIPSGIREAAFALGATRFQVVSTLVLPQATPGILTGTILAVSRGAGEVAPILFTGAAYFLPELPKRLSNQFMHLGYHVYVLATQSPDVDATEPLLFATVAVLLGLVFVLNAAAMMLRARLWRRRQ